MRADPHVILVNDPDHDVLVQATAVLRERGARRQNEGQVLVDQGYAVVGVSEDGYLVEDSDGEPVLAVVTDEGEVTLSG